MRWMWYYKVAKQIVVHPQTAPLDWFPNPSLACAVFALQPLSRAENTQFTITAQVFCRPDYFIAAFSACGSKSPMVFSCRLTLER